MSNEFAYISKLKYNVTVVNVLSHVLMPYVMAPKYVFYVGTQVCRQLKFQHIYQRIYVCTSILIPNVKGNLVLLQRSIVNMLEITSLQKWFYYAGLPSGIA